MKRVFVVETPSARRGRRKYISSPAGREMVKRSRQNRAAKLKQFLADLKRDRPCADCGGVFDPVCMDFDHLDSSTKLKNVAKLVKSGKRLLLAEIAKCELVCANCHRLRTHRKRDHKVASSMNGGSKQHGYAVNPKQLLLIEDNVNV